MPFNFFGKKKTDPPVAVFIDNVYISTAAKLNACLDLARKEPNTIFICWFPDTLVQFNEFFRQNGVMENCTIEARHIHSAILQFKTAVFTEHHPLHKKETELVTNWTQKEIKVFNALDEPFLKHFGSEKIISLMKQMGIKDDEALQHPMINRAIINAQEKIASKLITELAASSQAAWMEKNVK